VRLIRFTSTYSESSNLLFLHILIVIITNSLLEHLLKLFKLNSSWNDCFLNTHRLSTLVIRMFWLLESQFPFHWCSSVSLFSGDWGIPFQTSSVSQIIFPITIWEDCTIKIPVLSYFIFICIKWNESLGYCSIFYLNYWWKNVYSIC
jgi:hypothetical protein